VDKKEREAQAWKDYLKMQIQEKKDRIAREEALEKERDARAAARYAKELEMEERALRGEPLEDSSKSKRSMPADTREYHDGKPQTSNPPQKSQNMSSRLPVLRGLPRHLEPMETKLQPLVERMKEISDAVLHPPVPSKSGLPQTKRPHPPLAARPLDSLPSSTSTRKPSPRTRRLLNSKKVIQTFPIRGDLSTPPKNGIRVWPAGPKASFTSQNCPLPPPPLPRIPQSNPQPQNSPGEAVSQGGIAQGMDKRLQEPSIIITHRSPRVPPRAVTDRGLTPIPPPMVLIEESLPKEKEESRPTGEPRTQGRHQEPRPSVSSQPSSSSTESHERQEAVEHLQAVWKDFVQSKTLEYGIS
jgi:hypothetical protein